MDGSAPIVIAIFVGLIGMVGLFAAGRAAYEIGRERAVLRRGQAALRDLPMPVDAGFDYRSWINDRGAEISDSHFGDHLRAASDASKSGRAVSLHELHEVSARREARRIWARLSGGVTALLLVCGIAGTLAAIKPVLEGFNLQASPAGITQGAENADQATKMIQSLSRAFLPSLVALVLTVFVAVTRGFYAHRRGELAGELDQLDMEDIFPRFPPPSVSRELDQVRAQLGDLTTQMLASQRNLDGFVAKLTGAATGFGNDAPPLRAASQQFADAAADLGPKLDKLISALDQHLGQQSPVVRQFAQMHSVGQEVKTAAAEMQMAGAVMSKHLMNSHKLLLKVADELPEQIKAGCQKASSIIADKTAAAIEAAGADAVQALDAAAEPIRRAADRVAKADADLRTDVVKTVNNGVQSIDKRCIDTSAEIKAAGQTMTQSVATTLQQQAARMDQRVAAMETAFAQALADALSSLTPMHDATVKAIDKTHQTVDKLDGMQKDLSRMVKDHSANITAMSQVREGLDATTSRVAELGQQIGGAANAVSAAGSKIAEIGDRLEEFQQRVDRVPSVLEAATKRLEESQRENATLVRDFSELSKRVEPLRETWSGLLAEIGQLLDDGNRWNEEQAQTVGEMMRAANELKLAIDAASEQQGRLSANISEIDARLAQVAATKVHASRGWFGHRRD